MSDEEICCILGICCRAGASAQQALLATLMAHAYGTPVAEIRTRIARVVKAHRHPHGHEDCE